METKLTIEHLCPYLPYGLKVLRPDGRTILTVEGIANGMYIFTENGLPENTYGDLLGSKPILRPLSSITHEEMEGIIKSAWGWKEVVAFYGVDSVSVCIKGTDYDPSKFDGEYCDNYDVQYIDEQEESCGHDSVVTVQMPFRIIDVISYGWHDEFMYSVDVKHHIRLIQELYRRHFDLHGLIKAGLAIEEGASS